MKNTIIFAAVLFAAVAANAQTTPDSTQQKTQTQQATMPQATATVLSDTSINSAYIADPEALKGLKTEDIRPEHAFPILGSYTPTGSSAGNVTITPDSANKGIVWVEGLSQGKFRALMKKAPATYKIPAQTTAEGKNVPEGTLFYNPSSKEVTIVLGRPFDEVNPASFQTTTDNAVVKEKVTNNKQKVKVKGWQYTGVKAGVTTMTNTTTHQ